MRHLTIHQLDSTMLITTPPPSITYPKPNRHTHQQVPTRTTTLPLIYYRPTPPNHTIKPQQQHYHNQNHQDIHEHETFTITISRCDRATNVR